MRRGVSSSSLSYSLVRTQAALQEYESSVAFWLSDVRGRAAGEKGRADFYQGRLRERDAEVERLNRMLAASEGRLREREAEVERLSRMLVASEGEVLHLKSQLASFEKLGGKPGGVGIGGRGSLFDQSMGTTADLGSTRAPSLDSPSHRSHTEATQGCLVDTRLALAHEKLERAGIAPPFDLQHWCTFKGFGAAAADRLAELGVAEEADLAQVTEDELRGFLTHIEVSRFQKLAKEAQERHKKEEVWMEAISRIRLKFLTCCCHMPPTECCCRLPTAAPAQIEDEPVETREPVVETREPVVVYPPSKDVKVFIYEHGKQHPIDETTSVNPLMLPDGIYQIKAEIHRKLVLDERVTVSGGVPDKKFFDTGAVLHRLEFLLADQPSKDAIVTLEMDTGAVTRRTDAAGIIDVLLLPGQYKQRIEHVGGIVQNSNLEVVRRDHLDKDPMVPPVAILKLSTHKCEHLHLHVDKIGGPGSLVIMGDVSGSMGGAGMDVLKKTFLDVYAKMAEHAKDVAFYTWNGSLLKGRGMFKGSDLQAFTKWTASLQAGGGTDFRAAVQQLVAEEPQAQAVWVLCDGDLSFSDDQWRAFVQRHSGITFNFAAMGNSAREDAMQRFAAISGGRFSKGTWD